MARFIALVALAATMLMASVASAQGLQTIPDGQYCGGGSIVQVSRGIMQFIPDWNSRGESHIVYAAALNGADVSLTMLGKSSSAYSDDYISIAQYTSLPDPTIYLSFSSYYSPYTRRSVLSNANCGAVTVSSSAFPTANYCRDSSGGMMIIARNILLSHMERDGTPCWATYRYSYSPSSSGAGGLDSMSFGVRGNCTVDFTYYDDTVSINYNKDKQLITAAWQVPAIPPFANTLRLAMAMSPSFCNLNWTNSPTPLPLNKPYCSSTFYTQPNVVRSSFTLGEWGMYSFTTNYVRSAGNYACTRTGEAQQIGSYIDLARQSNSYGCDTTLSSMPRIQSIFYDSLSDRLNVIDSTYKTTEFMPCAASVSGIPSGSYTTTMGNSIVITNDTFVFRPMISAFPADCIMAGQFSLWPGKKPNTYQAFGGTDNGNCGSSSYNPNVDYIIYNPTSMTVDVVYNTGVYVAQSQTFFSGPVAQQWQVVPSGFYRGWAADAVFTFRFDYPAGSNSGWSNFIMTVQGGWANTGGPCIFSGQVAVIAGAVSYNVLNMGCKGSGLPIDLVNMWYDDAAKNISFTLYANSIMKTFDVSAVMYTPDSDTPVLCSAPGNAAMYGPNGTDYIIAYPSVAAAGPTSVPLQMCYQMGTVVQNPADSSMSFTRIADSCPYSSMMWNLMRGQSGYSMGAEGKPMGVNVYIQYSSNSFEGGVRFDPTYCTAATQPPVFNMAGEQFCGTAWGGPISVFLSADGWWGAILNNPKDTKCLTYGRTTYGVWNDFQVTSTSNNCDRFHYYNFQRNATGLTIVARYGGNGDMAIAELRSGACAAGGAAAPAPGTYCSAWSPAAWTKAGVVPMRTSPTYTMTTLTIIGDYAAFRFSTSVGSTSNYVSVANVAVDPWTKQLTFSNAWNIYSSGSSSGTNPNNYYTFWLQDDLATPTIQVVQLNSVYGSSDATFSAYFSVGSCGGSPAVTPLPPPMYSRTTGAPNAWIASDVVSYFLPATWDFHIMYNGTGQGAWCYTTGKYSVWGKYVNLYTTWNQGPACGVTNAVISSAWVDATTPLMNTIHFGIGSLTGVNLKSIANVSSNLQGCSADPAYQLNGILCNTLGRAIVQCGDRVLTGVRMPGSSNPANFTPDNLLRSWKNDNNSYTLTTLSNTPFSMSSSNYLQLWQTVGTGLTGLPTAFMTNYRGDTVHHYDNEICNSAPITLIQAASSGPYCGNTTASGNALTLINDAGTRGFSLRFQPPQSFGTNLYGTYDCILLGTLYVDTRANAAGWQQVDINMHAANNYCFENSNSDSMPVARIESAIYHGATQQFVITTSVTVPPTANTPRVTNTAWWTASTWYCLTVSGVQDATEKSTMPWISQGFFQTNPMFNADARLYVQGNLYTWFGFTGFSGLVMVSGYYQNSLSIGLLQPSTALTFQASPNNLTYYRRFDGDTITNDVIYYDVYAQNSGSGSWELSMKLAFAGLPQASKDAITNHLPPAVPTPAPNGPVGPVGPPGPPSTFAPNQQFTATIAAQLVVGATSASFGRAIAELFGLQTSQVVVTITTNATGVFASASLTGMNITQYDTLNAAAQNPTALANSIGAEPSSLSVRAAPVEAPSTPPPASVTPTPAPEEKSKVGIIVGVVVGVLVVGAIIGGIVWFMRRPKGRVAEPTNMQTDYQQMNTV